MAYERVVKQITDLEQAVEHVAEPKKKADEDRRAVMKARERIAALLQVGTEAELHSIAAARERSARVSLDEEEASFQRISTATAGAGAQRAALFAVVEDMEATRDELAERLVGLRSEQRSCRERIAARGEAAASAAELTLRLAQGQTRMVQARNNYRVLAATLDQANSVLAGLRLQVQEAERELAQAIARRDAARASANLITAQWSSAGLEPPPSQAALETARSNILRALDRIDELVVRHGELGGTIRRAYSSKRFARFVLR